MRRPKIRIHIEATMFSDLYRDAGFFNPEAKERIRAVLREYADYILKQEWRFPMNQKFHVKTQKILEKLSDSYYDLEIQTIKEKICYEQSIGKLDSLMNDRLNRELNARQHLGTMMWSLLIIGAAITIRVFLLNIKHSQSNAYDCFTGRLSFFYFISRLFLKPCL